MSQVFDSLNKEKTPQNPMQALNQLKADPAKYIQQMGFSVPGGVDMKNPQSIINALMQSGQVPASRYQQAMKMMQGHR